MAIKVKNIIITILISILALALTSCGKGSFLIRNGSINHKDNEYFGSYDFFDGYIEFKLDNRSKIKMEYEITTESGELKLEIINESNENIISINGAGNDDVLIVNDLEEVLILRINAKKHKGSFRIKVVEEK